MNDPYGIRTTAVDPNALAAWTHGVDRSKRAYYGAVNNEEARIKAAEANRRYRARKKEQQK